MIIAKYDVVIEFTNCITAKRIKYQLNPTTPIHRNNLNSNIFL